MRDTVRTVQYFLAASARSSRMSQTDFAALLRIVTANGLAGAELRRVLGMTSSSVTELADRLEAGALIARTRSASDRRMVLLKPTALGRRTVDQAVGPLLESLMGLVDRLADAERAAFAAFLREVGHVVSEAALDPN